MNKDRAIWIARAMEQAKQYRLLPPDSLRRGPNGLHLGNGIGSSIEFRDFREYQPGDDLRRVDWGAYARGVGLMLRLYREEIAPQVEIILDTGSAMGLFPHKAIASVVTAALIAGVTLAGQGKVVLHAGRQRFSGLEIPAALESISFEGPSTLHRPDSLPATRGGQRFVISDFLFPSPADSMAQRLAGRSANLTALAVLTHEEVEPTIQGGWELIDCGAPSHREKLYLDSAAVHAYRHRLHEHLSAWTMATQRLSGLFAQLTVGEEDIADLIARQLLSDRVFLPTTGGA
jgi:hypothetical protein